jgi:cell division protein FtsZ
MIQLHRNHSSAHDVRIKIVGLGGAGGNVLDRLLLDGTDDAELVTINTDVQALTASVVTEKVQLGRTATRGLGAGGDPEVGYAAAEEGMEEIRRALEGARMVFLCVGLGGGTGSGAARIIASIAREQKALVVAFATLPFAFEGKRRRAQADEALGALQRYADVVIHFENDRMGDAVAPLAGIQDAFAVADQTLSQSIRAIAGLVRRRGLVHIGFDELSTALRGAGESGAHCVFGYGEAAGDNRAHEALEQALKSPLMDKGRMLEGARNILVNVAGGSGMTLNEVQILMEEFNRHISDQTRLLFGAAVDPALGQKMSVTILSALEGDVPAVAEVRSRPAVCSESSPASIPPSAPPRTSEPAPVLRSVEREPDALIEEPLPARSVAHELVAPPAEEPVPLFAELEPEPAQVVAAAAKPAGKPKPVQAKQEQMQFEPVTRGRFEKSEPTIVDGQDLDVPTFLRRNVKVK